MKPDRRSRRNAARALALTLGIIAAALASSALAHYPWIVAASDGDGEEPGFRIHFGHAFPSDRLLAPEAVAAVRWVDMAGEVQELDVDGAGLHPLPAGGGLLVAEQTPIFWSRTHEGGRRASREQYPDAFSCSQSGNAMKAIVGRESGVAWQYRHGHALELVPLSDPASLDPGDSLELRVLLHGEPWVGEVKATFAGYRGQDEQDYAVTVSTDAEGVARIVPATVGYWLVRAHASEDYPDPDVCDRRNYYSTLTFVVR
ncbi:ABC-type Co2+ transport system periplasmic component-like protein [Thioalkalivibrio nitratireducens DSM 14787]|uniref:ABC-type Co2+ transport system periplasmic component-like protein n=1 Tax=Thioalkalivibrio nitratireducens (strain DSM 14787 / UNIQEM 213 / ALEN2) TaxID=1255043 RepID=L0DVI4_THIND|nr:DUF4198 domain-containing protein [Thioalkalivibrio nitratireducens]AGA32990.1 ABC-type Co2+ transport system periplasmic component-like protein [Thioalkalivibrio nitratireducens DSM 14787]